MLLHGRVGNNYLRVRGCCRYDTHKLCTKCNLIYLYVKSLKLLKIASDFLKTWKVPLPYYYLAQSHFTRVSLVTFLKDFL